MGLFVTRLDFTSLEDFRILVFPAEVGVSVPTSAVCRGEQLSVVRNSAGPPV